MAAAINEKNKSKGKDKIYNYQDIRNKVAKIINNNDKYTDSNIAAIYYQEYDTLIDENNKKDLEEARQKMVSKIKDNRWATELDLSIISENYKIGIILLDDNGELYKSSMKFNNFRYYTIIHYKPKLHFQSIAFKKKKSDEPFKYLFKCSKKENELPQPIIDIINKAASKSEDIIKFDCP